MDKKPEMIFPSGLIFKNPKEGAPDFIDAKMSFKTEEFIKFLRAHDNNGWVNMDVRKPKDTSKSRYVCLDQWKPDETKRNSDGSELPFF